jgi:hypothetical protein
MRLKTTIGLVPLLAIALNMWLPPAHAQDLASRQQNRQSAHQNIVRYVYGETGTGLADKCGLRAITYALANRASLPQGLQNDLQIVLSRPSLQKSIVSSHFRIHYDTAGPGAPALLNAQHLRIEGTANGFADSVAAIANYVYDVETGGLGYLPPPSDGQDGGGPEYDIYVVNFGNQYGQTTPETPLDAKADGGTFTTFMEIDHDFTFVRPDQNKGLPALRVTIAHEFHHAIQLGNYGYWVNETYYYEMTSTWMEDVVYNDVNDYYQYLRDAFQQPQLPFTSTSGVVDYGRAIWCHYVAKRFGREAVRRSWEEIRSASPLIAIDHALQGSPFNSSFPTAFAEWTQWNYFTGARSDADHYPEGSNYPVVVQDAVGFTPPSRDVSGSLGPLAAKYYQVLGSRDTLTLVLANLNVQAAQTQSGALYPYVYHLNSSQIDPTYTATKANIFYKLEVSDPANWSSWDGTSVLTFAPAAPYPNPFLPDGTSALYFPVPNLPASQRTPVGTLSVFSSSLDLIYTSAATSPIQRGGGRVFSWKGITNDNELAQTGVYFYVIDFAGQTTTGKIVLIRK